MQNEWLKTEHPIYQRRKVEWQRNECRFRGGLEVLQELRRFDWEEGHGIAALDRSGEYRHQQEVEAAVAGEASLLDRTNHYGHRQREAVYINFMQSFASLLIGHLMRQAPQADTALQFGSLGNVVRAADQRDPTQAELVYYNTDGVGNDGSQWDNFWTSVGEWSVATGHRWMFVEAPAVRASSFGDEIRGQRPWLVSYSPLKVTNWHEVSGRLEFVVIRIQYREPRVVDGKLEGNDLVDGFRVLVREGFAGLGDAYKAGGWWDFDKDGTPIAGREGRWEGSKGEIPMWRHYYERDPERLSRSGGFELGQAAIAYMNADSAAGFDAWDASASMQYFLGVDQDGFNLAVEKAKRSRMVPVPANTQTGQVPVVYDGSMGAVTAEVYQKRLQTIRDAVRELASLEVSGGPDASGLAKQMGFLDRKSPRLRLLASEMESSQNTAIHFLALRFGKEADGSVKWARDFDLAPLLEQIDAYLDIQEKAGAKSATITSRALIGAAEESGLITDDDDKEKLRKEFETSIIESEQQRQQEREALNGFLPGGGGKKEEEPASAGAE